MLTLMTGLALSCLDTAIVNVALPAIARDLRASPANSIWVINAYQLAVMIALLPFASFGDIFGDRRVYRYGLMVVETGYVGDFRPGTLVTLQISFGAPNMAWRVESAMDQRLCFIAACLRADEPMNAPVYGSGSAARPAANG